jgi:integrase
MEGGIKLGKDLRGRELGKGICQRKDGLYTARFTDREGKRRQKYFNKLQECRKWIADMQFAAEHSDISAGSDMTVDAWFNYFMENIKKPTVRSRTEKNYLDRYTINIKPHIGNMIISEVKPLHCQNILNNMKEDYRTSSIETTRVVLHSIFDSAVDNELLLVNPVKKSVKTPEGKPLKESRVLTIEEQKVFLEGVKGTRFYNQYAFILQTGFRVGEMIALKWSDIDFNSNLIHISKTMHRNEKKDEWILGPAKSSSGIRDIPITQVCREILLAQKEKIKSQKIINKDFEDFFFVNEKGRPLTATSYDVDIMKKTKLLDINHFSMHTLRHTYATRCIEAGMRPKTLQMLLGHSNISVTMNLYVHVTETEKQFEILR